jgi:ribosome-interacting GTPase 1
VKCLPANLPPQAQALWVKAQDAKTPDEKLQRLQEFLSAIPDHKGTEKLRHQVRHQIAVLKEEIEEAKQRRKGTGVSYLIEKEGAAQVALVGAPDSGKTALLKRLTGVAVSSSSLPFETQKPVPGMMRYEDLLLQLVDTPSISLSQSVYTTRAAATARNADVLLLVVDGSQPAVPQLSLITDVLERYRVHLRPIKAQVKIEKRSAGGVQVLATGRPVCTSAEVVDLLKQYGLQNALVVINGPAELDDVEAAVIQGLVFKPSVVAITKLSQTDDADAVFSDVKKRVAPIRVLDAEAHDFSLRLGAEIVSAAGIIRVYTKSLNDKNRSARPLVMKKGSTVLDAVRVIHSAMLSTFEYARVWGSSVKFQGAKVGLEHVLNDGDVVEIHG